MKMISNINRNLDTKIDRTVSDALFLHEHPGYRTEDLGYPANDYIILDLMRQFRDG